MLQSLVPSRPDGQSAVVNGTSTATDPHLVSARSLMTAITDTIRNYCRKKGLPELHLIQKVAEATSTVSPWIIFESLNERRVATESGSWTRRLNKNLEGLPGLDVR